MSLVDKIKIPHAGVLKEDFYILQESHVSYLRTHPETAITEVNGQQAEKYTGDFHGLLTSMNIPRKFHYFITRVNGYNTSTDYDGFRTTIRVPSTKAMNQIMTIYSSRAEAL